MAIEVGSFNCDCMMCLMLILKTFSWLRLIFGMFGVIGDMMDLMAIYKPVLEGKVKNENKTKASP